MNSNVPKKIVRHVQKAIEHYKAKNLDPCSYTSIYNYVKKLNENLKPVKNMRGCVRYAIEQLLNDKVLIKNARKQYSMSSTVLDKKLLRNDSISSAKHARGVVSVESSLTPASLLRNRKSFRKSKPRALPDKHKRVRQLSISQLFPKQTISQNLNQINEIDLKDVQTQTLIDNIQFNLDEKSTTNYLSGTSIKIKEEVIPHPQLTGTCSSSNTSKPSTSAETY